VKAPFAKAGLATRHSPYRPLDWAFEQDVGSSAGKMILCVICRLGNKTGQCFASIPKIAAAANCEEATVRKWVKDFLARGWLKERGVPGRCTRTFVIIIGDAENGTGHLAETAGSPAECVTQNPLNPESKPCRRSIAGRQHGLTIPPDATLEEVLKFYRSEDRKSG
jgi:hypothetical protein